MQVDQILQGNALAVLKTVPAESVDMVITSPPYYALRDYGAARWEGGSPDCDHKVRSDPHVESSGLTGGKATVGHQREGYNLICPRCGAQRVDESIIVWGGEPGCEHDWRTVTVDCGRGPDKTKYASAAKQVTNAGSLVYERTGDFCQKCGAWRGQLGLEPTPQLYIDHLMLIFDEIRRILKPTGSCWVNIADTYGAATKSLIGVPERLTIAMTDAGWVRRNTVIWYKPSTMPQPVKDRFTNDFEYLYFFTKNKKYYFEQQLEPFSPASLKDFQARQRRAMLTRGFDNKWDKDDPHQKQYAELTGRTRDEFYRAGGRNKRCVWRISPKPMREAHFAVFPEALIDTPIRAACPPGGVVLDTFMGSGTTAVVAKRLGRHYLGVELNPDYIMIAKKRLSSVQMSLEGYIND